MRYRPINPKLFIENRQRLISQLEPKSMVIVVSNDIMPTSADGTMAYRQNSDLFYLTGVDQTETILVLFPEAVDEERRELLFVRETNDLIRVWEGPQLTKAEATKQTGIANVHWVGEFDRIFRALMIEAEHVYLNSNEHTRADLTVESRELRFVRDCQRNYPLHHYRRLAPLLHWQRSRKTAREVELLRTACAITNHGFKRVLRYLRPGVTEYQIEAEFSHEFLRRGAAGFAYTPIIGTGVTALGLHYVRNDATCRAGELVLMDVAAEYAHYAADMTRTVPVSGKFSRRQRAVYNAVLRVMRAATQLQQPGKLLKEYHKEVGELMEKELIDLKLLKLSEVKRQDPKQPAYKKYFMHGTSHVLGLDVHDVGLMHQPIALDMVFTCEPAIYIPAEKLAVRLENDILIAAEGNIDLMADIPVEADDIEKHMGGRRK